ncbi:SIT4 phosphatase-associated protein [Nitzschia inconspicua]|uniref:SIT4 phosphatase-associated protein n=1 Tax=Nitzschia inconspicua TaxID=303405 RepID=A0A9K3L5B3_9STRA|nr:SIT4 phosphatase-associated protein [Nitzschia inconspicua]
MSLLDAAGVVTGDIWCSGAFSFESPLKDLLDSGEYTLEQLLAEDELLQELRGMHPQLIEFLSSEESVAGLIQYAILPPEGTPPHKLSSPASHIDQSLVVEKNEGEIRGDDKDAVADVTKNGESEETDPPSSTETSAAEAEPTKELAMLLRGEDVVQDKIPVPTQTEQEERDALYVRFPYMACEVICCEVDGIVDVLVSGFVPASMEQQRAIRNRKEEIPANENNQVTEKTSEQHSDPRGRSILDLLFSILNDSEPGEIDDYRAGYFDKILSVLFRKRPHEMSDYINSGGGRGGDVLMAAMFKHLYSHSIMQIVQRLLLPQQPLPPKSEQQEEGEDLFMDSMEGADIDGLGSFRCDWSQSQKALEMLLNCLIGDDIAPQIDQDEEKKLSLYQNASEVLITIIQNSQLTSPTLYALTADPVLERLVVAATATENGIFSNHDSRLTCAMNVLESLILQLGGYGSVGTMPFPEEDEGDLDMGVSEVPTSGGDEEPAAEAAPVFKPGAPEPSGTEELFATTETLILHLPEMLSSLSGLLQYRGADEWVSPMQFSKSQPQKILGSSRLRIVRLLESLVLLGDPNVDAILCSSDCLEVCLDLFWKFQWCSMLHQSVANLLVHVFEGQNARSELQSYFVDRCNLLGRLMDSFWEGTEDCIPSPANISNAEISLTLMNQKDGTCEFQPISSVVSEKGSADNDILPVSDDDVDAAMEQQEDAISSLPLDPESSTGEQQQGDDGPGCNDVPDHTPAQSFRLGYMGHVIIICQALVHACTNDGKSEGASLAGVTTTEESNGELETFVNKMNGEEQALHSHQNNVTALERGRAGESVATEDTPSMVPLVLAQLVDAHPLSKNWQEFIGTTLATETAIQSSPLGGFQGGAQGSDMLQSHRPGLAEGGAYDDDDGASPLPPRGLLVGGDVIDMDDNDLDVAASMMAGMRLHQPDGSTDDRSRDLLSGITSQSNGLPQGGYVFDDPLGDGRFGKFDAVDDQDDSSSDEESELSGNTGDSGGATAEGIANDTSEEIDAPVMDLFAGNFADFGEKADVEGQNGTWSDFANFDDAFASAQTAVDNPAVEAKINFDDVFGDVKDHTILLEDLDDPPSRDEDSPVGVSEGQPATVVTCTTEDSSQTIETTLP